VSELPSDPTQSSIFSPATADSPSDSRPSADPPAWTTPTTDDAKGRLQQFAQGGTGLSAQVQAPLSWPTPAVFDTSGGPYPTQLTAEGFVSFHNGIPHGAKLSDAVNVEPQRSVPSDFPRSIPMSQPSSRSGGPMSPTSAPFSASPEIQSLRAAVSSRLSSLVDFLASRTASPASEDPSSIPAISGMSAYECFGSFDPSLPSSRMLAGSSPPVAIPMPRMVSSSLDFFSIAYCRTWPRFGTLASGRLYQQPTLERPTGVIASGSSASTNFPTPRANDAEKRGDITADPRNGLPGMVENQGWATPRAEDGERGKGSKFDGLPEMVRDETSWPTPRQSEHKGVGPIGSKSHQHMLDRDYLSAVVQEAEHRGPPPLASGPPDQESDSTPGSPHESWATPKAITGGANSNREARGAGGPDLQEMVKAQTIGKLNPSWVETLMGLPLRHTQISRKFVKPRTKTG
jgi:hypothetical protein